MNLPVFVLVAALLLQCHAQAAGENLATAEVEVTNASTLRRAIMGFARAALSSSGMAFDESRAQLVFSSTPVSGIRYELAAMWNPTLPSASLPLQLVMRPMEVDLNADVRSVKITVAVPLLRPVWVAGRRLRKGDVVHCDDVELVLRKADQSSQALTSSCVDAHAVALRELGRGDVLRQSDLGPPFAVYARRAVQLNILSPGVVLGITGIALNDGRLGDEVEVKLRNPTRTLKGRVVYEGTVQHEGGP